MYRYTHTYLLPRFLTHLVRQGVIHHHSNVVSVHINAIVAGSDSQVLAIRTVLQRVAVCCSVLQRVAACQL